MGSAQTDAFQGHRIGNIQISTGGAMPINRVESTVVNQGGPNLELPLVGNYAEILSDGIHGAPRMAMETRPSSTAFYPRVHA